LTIASVADYLGTNRSAYRCLDILDREGPMTPGRLASAHSRRRRALRQILGRSSLACPANLPTRQAGHARPHGCRLRARFETGQVDCQLRE
jgi:hypothetical protein